MKLKEAEITALKKTITQGCQCAVVSTTGSVKQKLAVILMARDKEKEVLIQKTMRRLNMAIVLCAAAMLVVAMLVVLRN